MTSDITEVSSSMKEIITSMQEMSLGTTEITTSLSSLVNITNDVKTSSGEIVSQTDDIETDMNEMTILSEQNNSFVGVISDELSGINTEITNINHLGKTNIDNLKVLEREIKHFTIIDTSTMKSSDGQRLIQWNILTREIPPRPSNPAQFPENDEKHWYDFEFSGWNVDKYQPIQSQTDGSKGKTIICLQPGDHSHFKGHGRGMQ